MAHEPVVEVIDLVKSYPDRERGEVVAVDGISFTVEPGEVYGFLGPNGAGKTTTLEIIEGLRSPTSGTTRVLGLDSRDDRREMHERIGVQLQAGAYFDSLTLREILELFGSLYRHRVDPDELLARVDLTEKANALVRELSGGQAQRFSIVAAMVNDPDVVFLDEPTTGLDPQARRDLWEHIERLRTDEGKSIVLTTHYMEEAEALCDRIAIIDRGAIQSIGTPGELIDRLDIAARIRFRSDRSLTNGDAPALPGGFDIVPVGREEGLHELRVPSAAETISAVAALIDSVEGQLRDLQIRPSTLEDVFLSLTGRALSSDNGKAVEAS